MGVKGRMLSVALAEVVWQGTVGTAQGLVSRLILLLCSVHCA